jgi:hypothetical protein
VKIQDSADNTTFADVDGLAFTQATTAPHAAHRDLQHRHRPPVRPRRPR